MSYTVQRPRSVNTTRSPPLPDDDLPPPAYQCFPPPAQPSNSAPSPPAYSEANSLLGTQQAAIIDDREDILKSAEFVYRKLVAVNSQERYRATRGCLYKFMMGCCMAYKVESLTSTDGPVDLAYNIGYRTILHIMFASNPGKRQVILKFLWLLACCFASLVLVVLNCLCLFIHDENPFSHANYSNTSSNSTIAYSLPIISMMTVVSGILLVYTIVGFIMHIRFIVKLRACHRHLTSCLVTLNFSYTQNVMQHIFPELILYSLFACSLQLSYINDAPFLPGYSFSAMDTPTKLISCSRIISGGLLVLMVYLFRFRFWLCSIHLVRRAQFCTNATASTRSVGILSIFLFEAVVLSTLQILFLLIAFGFGIDSVWSALCFVLGYMCYPIGMLLIFHNNFSLFQGICVEFFHNICKKIIESSQHLRTSDQTTFHLLENFNSSVSATDGYSTCCTFLWHPCNNQYLILNLSLLAVYPFVAVCVMAAIYSYNLLGIFLIATAIFFFLAYLQTLVNVSVVVIVIVAIMPFIIPFGVPIACIYFIYKKVSRSF